MPSLGGATFIMAMILPLGGDGGNDNKHAFIEEESMRAAFIEKSIRACRSGSSQFCHLFILLFFCLSASPLPLNLLLGPKCHFSFFYITTTKFESIRLISFDIKLI